MIKIIISFDQKYSIPDEEVHKAYFLFLNPEKRGVFSNGVAVRGKDIQNIEPDYQGTMGWNPTHRLNEDDWNELRAKKIDVKLNKVITLGKEVAYLSAKDPELLNLPLSKVCDQLSLTDKKLLI